MSGAAGGSEQERDDHGFVADVLQGHKDAIEFVLELYRISQVLDDLYDQDTGAVDQALVHQFAWKALCGLPCLPFYQRHFQQVMPLMRAALLDWMDSCTLERAGQHGQQMAWVLRDKIGEILIHVSGIVHGDDYMRSISLDVRKHIYDESFAAYAAGLERAP